MILQISCAHLMRVHSPFMEVEDEDSANHTAGHHHLEHLNMFLNVKELNVAENPYFCPSKFTMIKD